MIRVIVPATTANMGPGFDSLGCALSLYARFECEKIDSGLWIEGCDERYRNEDNLFVRAFRRAERAMGVSESPIHVRLNTEVPASRGLGSSATLSVGGVLAANALSGNLLKPDECLALAVELEGHPDNAAPAMLGGMRASFMEDGKPVTAEVPIGENIGFIAMIPNFETKTSDMRRALPECVPMGDAIFNLSRVAVLIRAMETGNLNLIAHAMTDRLHQPYREKLIDDCDRARRAAMESGAAAFCISGSGSTCLAVADGKNAETIAEGIRKKLADSPYGWRVLHLNPDRCGARVEELR